ncbi:hypothetical protein R4B61_04445 [Fructilactobacillus vespulae]|uniref:hypothetical protein n=1 Tax=Fructilactobacillus vespulae TaxID=1249630 RepID=UPI0039B4F804
MNNDEQFDGMTRSQFRKHSQKQNENVSSDDNPQFNNETDEGFESLQGSRAERNTAEYKQKQLGKKLNIAIIVLTLLLILVLGIMRFVG